MSFTKATAESAFLILKMSVFLQNGQTRAIQQFHFTAWSDGDVPDDTESIVGFTRHVRRCVSRTAENVGPILVLGR